MRMTNVGFDVRTVTRGLEDWLLENHAEPTNVEGAAWPGARSECVRELAFAHCCEHGVPAIGTVNGRPAHVARCADSPCEVAAVSFALVELWRFESETSSAEVVTLRYLERVVGAFSASSSVPPARLLAVIAAIRDGLRSPAFRDEFTGGRPRMRLAQAVTHHLYRGGFSHAKVAAFMGAQRRPRASAARRKTGEASCLSGNVARSRLVFP